MSFAGAAAGGSASSLFWNPATMTQNPGITAEFHLTAIIPTAELEPTYLAIPTLARLGNSGDLAKDAILPATYASYQINDSLFLGLYVGAPFGMTTKPNPVWYGQAYARTTSVRSYEVEPTVAYKVNDFLSLGAGVRLNYFDVRYMSATGLTPFSPTAGLEGDSYGVGFSLGATFTPTSGTQIGIGYRSMVSHDLEGKFAGAIPIKAHIVLPESVSLGLRQRITDDLTLNATAEWTKWSRLRYPRVYNDMTGTLLGPAPFLPLGYDDGWFVSVGGEYKVTNQLTARAGVGYEWSPISAEVRSPRLPDTDRIWASIGAGYQITDRIAIDLAYTHLFPMDDELNIDPGNPNYKAPLRIDSKIDNAGIDIVSVALRIQLNDPKPVVRKY